MNPIKNKNYLYLVFGFIGGLVVLFQSCSEVKMSSIPEVLDDQVAFSIDGADANAVYYTNNRVLSVNIIVKTNLLDEVRISAKPEMNEPANPWQKVKNIVSFDLKDDYASDGSKDGLKTIYVEFRNSLSDQLAKNVVKSLNIFLDTQSPEITGEGYLTKGLRGEEHKKRASVYTEWKAADKLASSAQASGLHPNLGIRWGYSRSNDCSESALFEKVEWREPALSANISWPTNDPLDVFYICLFAQDRAGNINTYLSQPMTSLWTVIAGDNSQGNGASVNSPKVRFKNPRQLSMTKAKDILVVDADFQTVRSIRSTSNDPARVIESVKMPMLGDGYYSFDSLGNYYFIAGGLVHIVKKSDSTKAIKLTKDGSCTIALRKYLGTERLLMGCFGKYVKNDASADAYLYEVPIAKLLGLTNPLSVADLKATYKIAGNGVIPASNFDIPSGVTLTKNDPVDPTYSTGLLGSMAVGAAGEIYMSSWSNPTSAIGNSGVRVLTPNASGGFVQTAFKKINGVKQVVYHKQVLPNKSVREILLLSAGTPCGMIIDLNTKVVSMPFVELADHSCFGALIEPSAAGTDYSIYLTSGRTSQIYHYDSSYKLIEVLGRPVFDSIQDPLASLIGDSTGVFQAPDGDIYYVDAQNALIKKIDTKGVLSTVAGKTQIYDAKVSYNGEPLNEFVLGSQHFTNWQFQLVGDFNAAKNRKILYVPVMSGQIHALDLVRGRVTTLVKPPESSRENLDPYFWANGGIALAKGSGDQNLLLTTKTERLANASEPARGIVYGLPVRGAGAIGAELIFMGDLTKRDANLNSNIMNNADVIGTGRMDTVHVDSTGYVFVSGYQLKISTLSANPRTRVLSTLNIPNMGVIEDGTKRHFIYSRNSSLFLSTVDMTKVFDSTQNPILATATRLCLPGTTLNGVGQIATDLEGNILLTDSSNARIIKYRIRDAAGNLKWTTNCPAI